MALQRVVHEPAFVLHRYDWSESSLILEVFTRHHGRQAVVAKGVKRPSSSFRPILLPLQPLLLSFSGDADIKTLKAAEWQGGHVMPTGDALMSGYYLNELLLSLLGREDPHEALFDVYGQVVAVLASEYGEILELTLRAFELVLLREIGLLPMLDAQTMTLMHLEPQARYSLVPEGGLRLAGAQEKSSLDGAAWMGLQQALSGELDFSAVIRACSAANAELKPQLRALLHYHCGVPTLRTRQVMLDMQSL